jgi:hypothetical protein
VAAIDRGRHDVDNGGDEDGRCDIEAERVGVVTTGGDEVEKPAGCAHAVVKGIGAAELRWRSGRPVCVGAELRRRKPACDIWEENIFSRGERY